MYSIEQAQRLAADFLRRKSENWGEEVSLFPEDEYRAEKGEFFYFHFQGVKYIATRDDKYFLYGPTYIEVSKTTGECRFLSIHECSSVNPFGRETH